MQQVWLALIIGLIIGWLIEWLIDWRFWRKNVMLLRAENAKLQRRIAVYEVAAAPPIAKETPTPPATPATTAAAPTQQVE